MPSQPATREQQLQHLQRSAFAYFLHETNPDNGRVLDKTALSWPASIAATGLALASYPVAIERGLMAKDQAVERTLATLRFFRNSAQSPEPDATGYHGCWGITASEGPGPAVATINGVKRRLFSK